MPPFPFSPEAWRKEFYDSREERCRKRIDTADAALEAAISEVLNEIETDASADNSHGYAFFGFRLPEGPEKEIP